ncbi:MAG: single-stranded DNA-binding protein [Actinomycetia bacterium]|nr:single-stranded DNA-binding protein [Actinomycetes bacterium]
MDINKVILIGRLTKDPELKYTPDGIPVATLRIAVNRLQNRDGVREADFFNIVVWRKLAEICSEYLKKGKLIGVDGRLRMRNWTTNEGQQRSTIEVVAQNIQFLERMSKPQEAAAGEDLLNKAEEVIDKNDEDEIPF